MLEYIPGGLLYDLCENVGGLGEDGGHYFMQQLTDAVTYLHSEVQVVHRDLKLENILLDEDLNTYIGDFGFATFKKINKL